MQSIKKLDTKQMERINGGGNIGDCLAGASIGLGAVGLVAAGPVGWGIAAAAVTAAASGGFVTGYSCTSAIIKGD